MAKRRKTAGQRIAHWWFREPWPTPSSLARRIDEAIAKAVRAERRRENETWRREPETAAQVASCVLKAAARQKARGR